MGDCADCGARYGASTEYPGGCENTCDHSNDGVCDDGGAGATYSDCIYGTDCADCGNRTGCDDTCTALDWTKDGNCDDGGEGSDYAGCDLGTDCEDCGVRSSTKSTFSSAASLLQSNKTK